MRQKISHGTGRRWPPPEIQGRQPQLSEGRILRGHKAGVSLEEFEMAQLGNLQLAIELSALALLFEHDLAVLKRVIILMAMAKL